jgi:hypothetical protein
MGTAALRGLSGELLARDELPSAVSVQTQLILVVLLQLSAVRNGEQSDAQLRARLVDLAAQHNTRTNANHERRKVSTATDRTDGRVVGMGVGAYPSTSDDTADVHSSKMAYRGRW